MIAAAVGVAVGVLAGVAYLIGIWRYTMRRSPIGVVRALREHPDQKYSVRIHGWVPIGAWNPTQPLKRRGQVFGSGTATYRLDTNSHVHMNWTSESGPAHDYSGEIPAQLDPSHPEHRRRKGLLRVIEVVYGVTAVGGFIVGYLLSAGAATHRLGYGLAGIFVVLALLWVAVTAASVGRATRRTIRNRPDRRTSNREG